MKKVNYLLAAAAMVVGLASCNNDEEVIANANDTKVSLEINQVGLAGLDTKYAIREAAFSNGEKIGVYINRGDLGAAYNSGTTSTRQTQNVLYTLSGSSWSSTSPIMLTNVQGTVRAYYPYDSNNDSNTGTTIPVTIKADQGTGQSDGTKDDAGQPDYMFSDAVTERSNAAGKTSVDLKMNHALAMLTFKFQDDKTPGGTPYPNEGIVSEIKLFSAGADNKILSGNFTMNIQTGALTAATPTQDAGITVRPSGSISLKDNVTPAELPRILIAPITTVAENSTKVTVIVDGAKYTVTLPALATGYQRGVNYEYTFTLKGTGLEVSSVSIYKWSTEEKTGGEIQTPDNA